MALKQYLDLDGLKHFYERLKGVFVGKSGAQTISGNLQISKGAGLDYTLKLENNSPGKNNTIDFRCTGAKLGQIGVAYASKQPIFISEIQGVQKVQNIVTDIDEEASGEFFVRYQGNWMTENDNATSITLETESGKKLLIPVLMPRHRYVYNDLHNTGNWSDGIGDWDV